MAVIAFPSENAVGNLFGSPTRIVREQAMAILAKASTPSPLKKYVIAGFDVTAVPASNGVRLLTGSADYAIIDGTLISFDATVTLTGLTDNTHFIYAQLTRVSSLVTTWALTSNTTGTPPADSVALARVVVAAGVAGTPANAKKNPGCVSGTYVGSGSGTPLTYLGFNPTAIIVAGLVYTGPVYGIAFSFGGSGGVKFKAVEDAALSNHLLIFSGTSAGYGADPHDAGFTVTGEMNVSSQTYQYVAWA